MHSTKYSDPKKLGAFLAKLALAPNSIVDCDQFMLDSGNHTFCSNKEIVEENEKCPANFRKLRCKVFVKPDPNKPNDVRIMTLVNECLFRSFLYNVLSVCVINIKQVQINKHANNMNSRDADAYDTFSHICRLYMVG